MIIEKRVKEFEALGFGMFVHFGLYSILEKGEWSKHIYRISDSEYEGLAQKFEPSADWADRLAATASQAGCRYITLTTRHHDGFSLYGTDGLSDYDAPHSKCGRDLVAEFVDACNKNGVLPFFYHTLLDWHEKSYAEDFPTYLKYLRKSIEILCTKYGRIGGFWFDGKWDKPKEDWEEDELYSLIRRHQPDAIIVNNTGLHERGALGHIELDSVTFERGRPQPINLKDSPKYIASEMCQTLGDTWGYSANDLNYKSPDTLISDLCVCRRYGANLLLNVGPQADGLLRPLDTELLRCMGKWVGVYDEAIHAPRPTDITVENRPDDFILGSNGRYYLFCHRPGMSGDGNVVMTAEDMLCRFALNEEVKEITWMDNGEKADYTLSNGSVELKAAHFPYGTNLIVRVAEIKV